MPAEPRPTPTAPIGTVVVTGGSSGLGAAVVAKVAAAGGWPVNLDRRPPLDGAPGRFEQVDLADSKEAEEVVRSVAESTEDLRGVVTCAGTDVPAPFTELPTEVWERTVAVNLFGTAAVVRAALPALERNGGRVVTVASTLGFRVFPDATAYCASKFGVVGFTRALQAELKGRVGVTLLVPGGMATSFFDERQEQYKPGPDARLADPTDTADAILFALGAPSASQIYELVVAAPTETSWP